MRTATLVCVGALLVSASSTGSARATFPGTNGKIVFMRAGEIFAMNPDGSEQTNLTNNPAVDRFPAGSANGRRIAFTRNTGEDSEIFVMNADGSDQENLTFGQALDISSAWSPDGKRIAFASVGPDGLWDVYVMNADGSDRRNLTNTPETDWFPTWSPDGKKIAFESDRTGNSDIFVMNADGSGQQNLTNTSSPFENAFAPSWSPDGTKIAYSRGVPFRTSEIQGGASDVFVMNADGSGKTDLTNTMMASEADPVWSPDGTKIAFTLAPFQSVDQEIYVMNADGSGQMNLTNDPSVADEHPNWLPVPAPLPPPSPPACRVPKVVGLRLAPAKQRILRANCAVGRVRKVHSKRVGRVVAQSPRSGTRLPNAGRVNLVIGRK